MYVSLPQMGKVGDKTPPRLCRAYARTYPFTLPSIGDVLSTQLHPSHTFDAHGYMYVYTYTQRWRATSPRTARWRRQASSAEIDNLAEEGGGRIGVRVHPDDGAAGGREEKRGTEKEWRKKEDGDGGKKTS